MVLFSQLSTSSLKFFLKSPQKQRCNCYIIISTHSNSKLSLGGGEFLNESCSVIYSGFRLAGSCRARIYLLLKKQALNLVLDADAIAAVGEESVLKRAFLFFYLTIIIILYNGLSNLMLVTLQEQNLNPLFTHWSHSIKRPC